jgi:hypothetical protein
MDLDVLELNSSAEDAQAAKALQLGSLLEPFPEFQWVRFAVLLYCFAHGFWAMFRRARPAAMPGAPYSQPSHEQPLPERLLKPEPPMSPVPAKTAVAAPGSKEQPYGPMLAANRQHLDALNAALHADPLFDASKHDDLFLLRFLLSYEPRGSDVSAAVAAVRRSLSLRQIHKLDEVGHDLEHTPMRRWLDAHLHEQLAHAIDVHIVQPHPDAPLIVCTRLSECHFENLLTELGSANYVRASIMLMEFVSRRMDAATRRTGRLVKYIRAMDCSGLSSSSLFEGLRFLRMEAAKVIRDMQVLYPQMLGNVLFLHGPTTATVIYDRVIRPLMPSKVSQKTLVLCPRKWKAHAKLLASLVPATHLHTSYGGALETYYQPDATEPHAQVAHVKAAVMNEARRRNWPSAGQRRAAISAAELAELRVGPASSDGGQASSLASAQSEEGSDLHRLIMERIFGR